MYFKRPSFRRGGPTGIAQLEPRKKFQFGTPGFQFLEPGLQREFRTSYLNRPDQFRFTPSAGFKNPFVRGGLLSLPFAPSAAIAYMNKPKTLAEKKVMQQYGPIDETFFQYDEYDTDREAASKIGDKISFREALFKDPDTGVYPKIFGSTADREKRAAIEKAKKDQENFINIDMRGDPAQFSGEDELTDFDAIAEQMIPDKKIIDDDTPKDKEPSFEDTFEKEKSRIEKLIGDEDDKGMAAIALSEAIGTPGTIADKAAVLNKSLLKIASNKKKDKRDIAKLAYTATKEIEKAKIMANKEGYSEKLANEVRKYRSVLANPNASAKAKAIATKELEILSSTIETLNPNKVPKVMKPSEARANLKAFEKKAQKLAKMDKSSPDYQNDLASYIADIELLSNYPELYASIVRIDAANLNVLGRKDGGRIGFAKGTEPMNSQIPQGEVPTQETSALSYNEIRNRLPKEITDDIVKLIAESNEALQDFAYIRTQGDVDKFNMKYGVTLVLPQSTA